MQVLAIIKRNFVMNDEEDFRLLFNGYVRPHLEYCVHVWSPYLKKDIECLEKVQRRATKLVNVLKNKSYPERLTLLHTTSLAKRRTRGDLIQVFRILNGIDSVEKEHFSIWIIVAATVWAVIKWLIIFREVVCSCDKVSWSTGLSR